MYLFHIVMLNIVVLYTVYQKIRKHDFELLEGREWKIMQNKI